ncbi:MAG: gephyrin-like molybdotransferase Glp [Limisphaerales bacterium]
MISLEEAQERILAAVEALAVEEIQVQDALGRYLAAPIHSLVDLPPADNSAVDGYAVRAADLASATEENPVALRLSGQTPAGKPFAGGAEAGACVRIFTGAVLPGGADAVVMQEEVKQAADQPAKILFSATIKPLENVRLRGEDIRENALLATAGEEATAPLLSLLTGAGLASVPAGRRPVAGLLATGDELREAGRALPPGTIYEGARAGLSALARQAGAIAKAYPLVPDDLGLTKRALEAAFQECDVVATIGGVSVGEMDFVKQAFEEIGGQLDFWTVAMRPGRLFAFGRHGKKFLFGLPGNPVSAFVTFFLLARPALLRLQGAREVRPPVSWGMLAEPLGNRGQRRHFARVVLDADGQVRSAGNQASHILSSMARANGLVDMPPGATWPAGSRVAVLRWS